ncbi:MAG: hypothetical protein HOE44_00955 [Candidatus Marinimicrobia bacterium]|jgi:hypothetical protein|nr:hypothetical protein [Candidatus Neomarinimicrobiota bacterium]
MVSQEGDSSGDKKYWFPAKKVGLGWGLPIAWQGWLVFAIVTGTVVGGYFYFEHPVDDDIYAMVVLAATAFLLVVCFLKGEPLNRKS